MTASRNWSAEPTALIIAHPGHELLLHHWVERARPLVFILTDGSGGAESDRLEYSRRLINRCEAKTGGVFGLAPDKAWYRSILTQDHALLDEAIGDIGDECRRAGVTAIVCDAVELFNPVHDLANVAGHAVAEALQLNAPSSVWTYPIEKFENVNEARRFQVDEMASDRKLAAVEAYQPLANERARYDDQVRQRYELIFPDSPAFGWPETLTEEPYYESFGRRRLGENRYHELITYAEHVRPLALSVLSLKAAA